MQTYRAVYQDECLYRVTTFEAPKFELAIEQLLLGKHDHEAMVGFLDGKALWQWVGSGNGPASNGVQLADRELSKMINRLVGPVR